MKNKYIYCSLVALMFFAGVSCTKQLDQLPNDIISVDKLKTDESVLNAFVAGLYSNMVTQAFDQSATSTDEAMLSTYAIGSNPITISSVGAWWGYSQVRLANILLEAVPDFTFNPVVNARSKGEGYFARAFFYFTMVKRYGGIPIIKKVQNYDGTNRESLNVPRNTEKEVYDFIASDLDSAYLLLPERSETVKGHASRYTAMALKAKAMLSAASSAKYATVQLNGIVGIPQADANTYYKLAYDAAKVVINSTQYGLYNAKPLDKVQNFIELFIVNNNTECIFAVDYSLLKKSHTYDQAVLPIRITGGSGSGQNPTLELVEQFEYIDGTSGPLVLTNTDGSPKVYANAADLFADRDPRLLASIMVPYSTFRGVTVDVQAGLIDQGIKFEAGDYASMYNPVTHAVDLANGTIHIAGYAGLGSQPGQTNTGFFTRKYCDYNKAPNIVQSTQSWMVYRYGGLLLDYAEAAVEMGGAYIAEAKWALNEIRTRAGIVPLETAEVTVDRTRHERLVELAFEAERMWDLRRWRIADDVLQNTIFTALKPFQNLDESTSLNTAYQYETKQLTMWPKTFIVKAYYEPLDAAEMVKNPNLKPQNPLY